MTDKQITQANQLRNQGHSVRDIADQIGVSKSAVDRALKDEATLADVPVTATSAAKRGLTPESVELGKLDLALSHEREMTKLNLRKEELSIQRRQVELDAERVSNDKKLLALREEQGTRELQAEQERVAAKQDLFVNKFNRLLRELLKNCVDSTWAEADVDDYLARVKSLLTKVSRFCDYQAIDEEELTLHHNLKALAKLIEQTKEEHSHFFWSDVDFDFDKKKVQAIKSWLIDDFDKIYLKSALKISTEEDEADDSIDEEGDDEKESLEGEKELLDTFNELLSELTDNCDNTIWENSEYDYYQDRVEAFQTKLSEFVDDLEDDFDPDEMAITSNTVILLKLITDRSLVLDENEEDETVTVSANRKQKQLLDSLQVDDFWEEIEEE